MIPSDLKLRAIVFDMDGVIVDSEPLHLLAFQEFFEPFGVQYTDRENMEFLGRKDIEIAAILIERYDLPLQAVELVERKEAILSRLLAEKGQPRPGLGGLLDRASAAGLSMAVASSATLPTIELVVNTLGIRDYFSNLSSGDEVPHGKPAPDVYLLAASRLGIEPAFCLAIEDTAAGISAAKAAGMYCLSIPCEATSHQDHSHADFHLTSLSELDLTPVLRV